MKSKVSAVFDCPCGETNVFERRPDNQDISAAPGYWSSSLKPGFWGTRCEKCGSICLLPVGPADKEDEELADAAREIVRLDGVIAQVKRARFQAACRIERLGHDRKSVDEAIRLEQSAEDWETMPFRIVWDGEGEITWNEA